MIALKNLSRRKLRTLFALLGVAFSVAGLISITVIAEGTLAQFSSLVGKYRADILVSQRETADPIWSTVPLEVCEQIKQVEGVADCEPLRFTGSKLDLIKVLMIQGFSFESKIARQYPLVKGSFLTAPDRPEMLLGARAATQLHADIGSKVKLKGVEFTVVGLYETGIRFLDSNCILTLECMAKIDKREGNANLLMVSVKDRTQLDLVINRINKAVPDFEAYDSSTYVQTFDYDEMLRNTTLAITLLASIVAMLGILNTMLMSVFERTREIGLLRAVGWGRAKVVGMILQESLWIALVGGAVGLGLGYALAEILTSILDMGGTLDSSYEWHVFARGMLYSLCIGLLGGLIPAWKASLLKPAEALRYE